LPPGCLAGCMDRECQVAAATCALPVFIACQADSAAPARRCERSSCTPVVFTTAYGEVTFPCTFCCADDVHAGAAEDDRRRRGVRGANLKVRDADEEALQPGEPRRRDERAEGPPERMQRNVVHRQRRTRGGRVREALPARDVTNAA
jgi:hypothetical protein